MSDIHPGIEWHYSHFDQLTKLQLFAVLQARQKVFILEQKCLYPDIDETDKIAGHLVGWEKGERESLQVAAYLRVMAPGVSYPEVSIGRVLVSESARGGGLGAELMQRGLEIVNNAYPQSDIRISAQHYLERFYITLGFATTSEVYDEDGIPHIDMTMSAGNVISKASDNATRVL